jgi:hypothetical protein
LPQRCREVAEDHVEEDLGDGVLPFEQLPERFLWQDEQKRPLTRDRGDRRRAIVDETFVAERLTRTGKPYPDALTARTKVVFSCRLRGGVWERWRRRKMDSSRARLG